MPHGFPVHLTGFLPLPATLPQVGKWQERGEQLVAAHSSEEMVPKPAGGQAVKLALLKLGCASILRAYPKNVTDASLCVGISGIGMPLVRFFG